VALRTTLVHATDDDDRCRCYSMVAVSNASDYQTNGVYIGPLTLTLT